MIRRLGLAVLAVLTGCSGTTEAPPAQQKVQPQAIADRFQKELQAELQAALKAGGPTAAIGVCQQAAPAIAASLSDEYGVVVRRIALKPRNPAAEVQGRAEQELQAMSQAPLNASGKPAIRQWGEGNKSHWMRAIPMKEEPCAVCHGTSISAPDKEKLDALYPEDKAFGFSPGDLRGAILISMTADN